MARKIGILSLKEKVGYALGDSASNFYWKVFEFFLLYYYTDVFGISPSAAGTMFLVTRIFDAVNDPAMGMIADRTKTRWGKFRPYLVWLAVPIGVAGVLMFTTPDFSAGGKLVYAYVTYILMMMLYTAINIPYSALMAVITPDTKERAQLSSFRFVGAFLVNLAVLWSTQRLVAWFGGGNEQRGWQLTMVLYGLIAMVLFLLCFGSTKERVEPPPKQRSNFKQDWAALLRNGPWLVMFFLGVLVITGFALRGATLIYYFRYYMNDADAFGNFMLYGGIANVIGIALVPTLTKYASKRRLYMISMGVAAVLHLPYYWLRPDQVTAIYGLNIAIGLILGPSAPLLFAMYADTADYGEWKTGRRTTGLVMAAAMLALKFGGAIGGAVNGWVLDLYGYVPNQAQTPEAIQGILLLIGVFPVLTGLTAAMLVLFYKLDDDVMLEIEADLKQRHAAEEASPA